MMLLSALTLQVYNTFICIRVIFTPLRSKNPSLPLSLLLARSLHQGSQQLYAYFKDWQTEAQRG